MLVLHGILLNSKRCAVKAEVMPAVCLDREHGDDTLLQETCANCREQR